jgi:hypothetical protein
MTASRVIHASSPDICPGQISWDPKIGKQFRGHSAVNHAIEEYVRGRAQLNNAEHYFFDFQAQHQWHLSGRQMAEYPDQGGRFF